MRAQLRNLIATGCLVAAGAAVPAAGCTNGAYLKADQWLTRRPASAELTALQAHFSSAAVRIVYVYGLALEERSPRPSDGEPFRTYAANLTHLRRALGAQLRFVAMIGRQRPPDQILALAKALWSAGFDGVQLDYEPLPSGSPRLPTTLALLREHKPSAAIVSVAMYMVEHPLLREPRPDAAQLRVWDSEYVATLVPLVDDVMVMNYDTNLRTRSDYVALTAAQTAAFDLLIGSASVRLNIGLISNVSGRRGLYDRRAENLAAGLEGVRRVWPRCPPGRGVTVFTVAGTTTRDWADIGAWARGNSVPR